ncbi:MAG: hypothetical protein LBI14_05590 [Treponema sp.]|jgi:hypothetical protein|nr:hypothetical protein [Treponema sp.]
MTKKRAAKVIIFLLFVYIFSSCNQNEIFFRISKELPPIIPRINGSSTNMVVYNSTLYVTTIGSSTIYTYKDGNWSPFSSPVGKIAALAATLDYLYALAYTSDIRNCSLHRYNGTSWQQITGGSGSLQSIWGANNTIFVGAMDGTTKVPSTNNPNIQIDVPWWKIYYVSGTDTSLSNDPIISDIGQLNGAAFLTPNYYIATSKGIYVGTLASLPTSDIVNGSTGNVTGIMNVNTIITAVTSGGQILKYSGTVFEPISTGGPPYTGAMGTWKENGTGDDKLLLLGTKNGYRELHLSGTGQPTSTLAEPGVSSPSSLSDVGTFRVTIAKHPVYHIIQVPTTVSDSSHWVGGQPLIFASTYINGVWSLKLSLNNGTWDVTWNGER